jgi:hypothetical protein
MTRSLKSGLWDGVNHMPEASCHFLMPPAFIEERTLDFYQLRVE